MVSRAFQSSSVVVLPKTPNLRDYSAITVDTMPSIIEESDFEMGHPSMPPRNLKEEFLAVATPPRNIDKELLAMLDTSLALIHR
ncbi:hypothetical protein RHSIM_Rhsim01G0070000 [Rhododendron simsii]|uniref:Uncharacterized protein n=1 Tax=Rhododendron simsii TaxID=118357 RepID=A0A834HHF6_RHOSS|nr:hypothetical protein RHSIM_Rhsim01G0070000 [Rhododendron simsii]